MSGFLGIGRSGAEDTAVGKLDNVFNYGLPTAQASQGSGTSALGDAGAYFGRLLRAGRQDTMQQSAPVVNAVLDQGDARRREQSVAGTGRTGGTAELNRQAGAFQDANIDTALNKTMVEGKNQAAEGEAGVGQNFLQNAAQMLGLATSAEQPVLKSGAALTEAHGNTGAAVGKLVAGIFGF
jgi:hypothetical protein